MASFNSEGKFIPNPHGRFPAGNRNYQIKHLQQVHHEVINLVALGHKPAGVAKSLGVTPAMVNYTVNSALGKEKLDLIRGARDDKTVDLAEEIRNTGIIAIARVKQVIEDQNATHTEALRAAFGMLDRIPETSIAKRIHTDGGKMHFTSDEIAKLKGAAFQSELIAAEVVESKQLTGTDGGN